MNIRLVIFLISIFALVGCAPQKEVPLFSGRVEYFYFVDELDVVSGVTPFEKGFPGTATRVKEDVWVDVYSSWVVVSLKNRRDDDRFIVPRDRVRRVIVGSKELIALNPPK
jgi:hypothetical protein